jgi:CheY-like chemotaxis protein
VPDALVGDPGRLRQVVVNLVGNAIKFTEDGEVVLEVKVVNGTDEHCELQFTVRDTGIGIPEDKRQHIFGAFSQADSSMSRRYGGTGLGLSISAQLVRLMGGRIWVESSLEQGSQFHFTADFALHQTSLRSETKGVAGLRILIVDDNATNRRILQEMLTNWHIHSVAADGAATALEELRHAHAAGTGFSLVLLDAMMPEVSGIQFLEQLRAIPEFTDQQVILLSSAGTVLTREQQIRLGVFRCLTKPAKQSELLDTIHDAVGERDMHRVAHASPPPVAGPPPKTLRVLVAEDRLANRRLVQAILDRRGHKSVFAEDGREAVDLAVADNFDVILMDMQMPRLDGLEATAEIREHERRTGGHVRIIAMTAHAMRGDRERCLAGGMDGYIAKPIRQAELLGLLENDGDTPAAPAQASPHPNELFDVDTFVSNIGDDPALGKELLSCLRTETPELMDQIHAAFAAQDTEGLARAAHALKGTLGNFFATTSATTARELEMAARQGRLDDANNAIKELQRQLPALIQGLVRFLDTM